MKPVRGVVSGGKIRFGGGNGEKVFSVSVPNEWEVQPVEKNSTELALCPDDGDNEPMVLGSDCSFRGKYLFCGYYRYGGFFGRRLRYVVAGGESS